jgi:hypothetical protein
MRRTHLVATIVLALAAMLMTAGAVAAQGFRTFVVELEPQAPNTEGSGRAIVRVNASTDTVCYVIRVAGIGAPTEPAGGLGAAHIHDLASGGIFVDLETAWRATGADRFTTIGCTEASSEAVDALIADPAAYYVNIHTTAFPGGAIRGPLG